jgi:hypothetical protein
MRAVVTATNSGGSTPASSAQSAVIASSGGGGGGGQTLNCFSSPSACGYPDPTSPVGSSSHVGPNAACSSLPSSGDVSSSSDGQTIQNLNISGGVTIANNNVTLKNVCVTTNGGGSLGSTAVRINSGVTGTLIQNATIRGADTSGGSVEMGVLNVSENPVTLDHSYVYNCGECVHDDNWTVTNSYVMSNGMQGTSDHIEAVYISDGSFTATHDTILGPPDAAQHAALMFGNVGGGGGGPCNNHWTVKGSLLAGGNWVLQACGNGSSVGSSSLDIESNNLARCTTPAIVQTSAGGWACQGYTGDQDNSGDGQDSHGYWANVGYFGVHDQTVYCGANSSQIWTGNKFDDNGANVTC